MEFKTFRRLREAFRRAAGPSTETLLTLAQAAANGGNNEEARSYYVRVLECDPKNYAAWLGKGLAAGALSTVATPRFGETSAAIHTAVHLAPPDKQDSVAAAGASALAMLARTMRRLLEMEPKPDTNELRFLRKQCRFVLFDAVRQAHLVAPTDAEALRSIVTACDDLLSGIDRLWGNSPLGSGGEDAVPLVKEIRADAVTKLRALDGSYQEPEEWVRALADWGITVKYK